MKKINYSVFIAITALLVSFDVYKAIHVSFTWDECYTYLEYVGQNVGDIVSYRHTDAANNHILNTLFMKFSEMLFGNSELALRLPNILAHILYLVFTFELFARYCQGLTIPFFILANMNPYLLDFFSLARGYGLAIGLMTTGLYYYCRFIENKEPRHHILSLICIGLASIANFTLLNVFLILILIHNIFEFIMHRQQLSLRNLWIANKNNLLVFTLFFIILYGPVKKIVRDKLIVVGGIDGFWSDTVGSLLQCFSYYQPYEKGIVIFWQVLVLVFSIFFIVRGARYLVKRDQVNLTGKISFFMGTLTLFTVLGTIIQHFVFGTPFLMSRFALFLYPLFVLAACFLIAGGLNATYKKLGISFSFVIAAIFFSHTCYSLNTTWYYEWRYMSLANAEKILQEIEEDKSELNSSISLGTSWVYAPIFNFYKQTGNLDWLEVTGASGISYINDYFFVDREELDKIPQNEIKVINHFRDTEYYLAKRVGNESFNFRINLIAPNKKYVCAEISKQNLVVANRDVAKLWETFGMIKLKDDQYAIRSSNYRFLSAEVGQQNQITARRSKMTEWETFTMVKLDSNHVAFKAFNGKYLTVDEKSQQLYARGKSIGEWERFEIALDEDK